MTIYPVMFWTTYKGDTRKNIKVEPFTSNAAALKRFNELSKQGGVEVQKLDSIDFTLNKPGVLAAFEYSQNQLRQSDYLSEP